MDAPLDLSLAPLDIVTNIMQYLCVTDRFMCALVCKRWAKQQQQKHAASWFASLQSRS